MLWDEPRKRSSAIPAFERILSKSRMAALRNREKAILQLGLLYDIIYTVIFVLNLSGNLCSIMYYL